ncbi:hypothetical protein B0J18DRAFT_463769 [Chaetomium sp. MPI-SDFR-AT-0129]|nr:hypothetical protein B0J18DRAFT_463769 [Chaetomium sp. MPI-SDFR-AT-0129]
MSADVQTVEDFRRAAVEQEQLRRVQQMKEDLDNFEIHFLNQENLDSLGVVMGRPLDVDHDGTWDFGTRFFQPWVPEAVVADVASDSIWMDQHISWMPPSEWEYGSNKARFFHYCLERLYEMDPELWEPWKIDPHQIRLGTGLKLPLCRWRVWDPLAGEYVERHYESEAAYFPVDGTKPHVACFVIDSNIVPGDQVLYSDVDYALALARFRLDKGQHTAHHTKPGIIYTLERDQFARITQVHLDAKSHKLVLRQSRQLDLRGPEPTPDAHLLVRWMASRPAGDTEYADETEPAKDAAAAADPPGTAPKLLLGCA